MKRRTIPILIAVGVAGAAAATVPVRHALDYAIAAAAEASLSPMQMHLSPGEKLTYQCNATINGTRRRFASREIVTFLVKNVQNDGTANIDLTLETTEISLTKNGKTQTWPGAPPVTGPATLAPSGELVTPGRTSVQDPAILPSGSMKAGDTWDVPNAYPGVSGHCQLTGYAVQSGHKVASISAVFASPKAANGQTIPSTLDLVFDMDRHIIVSIDKKIHATNVDVDDRRTLMTVQH